MGDDTQAGGAGLGLRRTFGAGETGGAATNQKGVAATVRKGRKKKAGAGGVRFRWCRCV